MQISSSNFSFGLVQIRVPEKIRGSCNCCLWEACLGNDLRRSRRVDCLGTVDVCFSILAINFPRDSLNGILP